MFKVDFSKFNFLKNLKKIKLDKNIFSKRNILIAFAVVVVIAALICIGIGKGISLGNIFGLSAEKVAKNTIDYINQNKLSATPASLVNFSEASGVVKIKIKIGENEFDSYVTKDGKLLFPQAIEITPPENSASDNKESKGASAVKSDNPELDAYVVSMCPFGLQMQRAIADAVKNIPSLAQYVKVRYIGSVSGNSIQSMHGDAEAKENLRQICIREEQPTKYWNYVSCDMKAGDSIGCEKSTGIDSAKLSACISDPSSGVAYAKKDFDLADGYGVSGSPTLILNGSQINESSFGGRSSDGVKSMVCAGFNTVAGFCSTELNKTSAAASYSATYASSSGSSDSNGGCGAAQ